MINQDEKTKKVLKIGGVIIGLVLVYSFFTLFLGKSSQSIPAGNVLKNNRMGEYAVNSPVTSMNSLESTEDSVSSAPMGKMMQETTLEIGSAGETDADDSTQVVDKKVIKNGDLSLRVESADWMAGEITKIAKQKGGEVFSTNFYEMAKGQKSGFLTVRVPVDKFDETIGDIKKIAVQVLSESTTGQDVTERYTDLQAQLKNKKAEEESFVKILGTAGKIDDVLAATREVARVRGEIERLEGKIRFMDSQTDMSTITINLTEDVTIIPVNDGWRPWQIVKQSFKELIDNMQGFADGVIRFIIVGIPSLIPFALLVGFLYWAGKKLFRKISA